MVCWNATWSLRNAPSLQRYRTNAAPCLDKRTNAQTRKQTNRGAFSVVHMAQSRSEPDDIVAIKCIDKKALRGKEDSLENEIRVLRRFVFD